MLDDKVSAESIDACFLDLPSPEKAQKHAYHILKKKGRVCNFSPCIEQVQKVSHEMAALGFYDIRTFECLGREMELKSFGYNSIFEGKEETEGSTLHDHLNKRKAGKPSKKELTNKRKAKSMSKSMGPVNA